VPVATPPPTRTPPRTPRTGRYSQREYKNFNPNRNRPQDGGRDGWRPPTPQTDPPLPPAPLLSLPKALILLGGSLWGMWNSRNQDIKQPLIIDGTEVELLGRFSPSGTTVVTWQAEGGRAGTVTGAVCNSQQLRTINYPSGNRTLLYYCGVRFSSAAGSQCGSNDWRVVWRRRIGSPTAPCGAGGLANQVASCGFNGFFVEFPKVVITATPQTPGPSDLDHSLLIPAPAPLPDLPVRKRPFPLPLPLTDPTPEPLPETVPSPAPPPAKPLAPPVAPPIPRPDPEPPPPTQPRPSPNPRPMPIPSPAPSPVQVPGPSQPLRPDGTPLPLPPATTPQTPPGTEDFLGEEIGQPQQAPPPTLQGIASEVGRIEQKLRVMSKQPSGGSADLGPLLEQLAAILERLTAEYPGGSYQLVGPCEPALGGGPGGSRSAAWGSGTGSFASIIARVDALAELMQHHKDLRQPICRQKASGEEVTVVFEEIG